MHLKPRKASTDPRLRSLLQKAARRGYTPIVERVAARLDAIGDGTWLRSRTVVIAFEECWPLGGLLAIDRSLASKLGPLRSVTTSVKQKDAAGLGALAYAHREGDNSMLGYVPDHRTLRIIAAALARPDDFWRWIPTECQSEDCGAIVQAAQRYLPVATWEWDKACILAGALLATKGANVGVDWKPATKKVDDFPYWVALDKHTDQGKAVLRAAAKDLKVSYRQLIWASFYCESAQVNELLPSPWFVAERTWRLARASITYEGAEELWLRGSKLVKARLAEEAETLKAMIESGMPNVASATQASLL